MSEKLSIEDYPLSEKRPDLAVRTSDGSIWHNNAGLGWTNPYNRRVWRYNVDLAAAAVKAVPRARVMGLPELIKFVAQLPAGDPERNGK